jgi:adenylate kinase family enzyme
MITILFGPPCVGKGTIAQELCSDPSYVLIPTGEIIRSIQGKPSTIDLSMHPRGSQLKAAWRTDFDQVMRTGGYLPDDAIIEMVELYKAGFATHSKFLYDGFPRNLKQAIALDISLRHMGHDPKDVQVVVLDAPDAKLVERNELRRLTEQREDDDPAIFAQRLSTFRQKALDLTDYYRGSGRLIEIDASGTREETLARIRSEIAPTYAITLPLIPPATNTPIRRDARAASPHIA